MKAGQSAFRADEELYQQSSLETANLCCLWLNANGFKAAAKGLQNYLNSDGLEASSPCNPGPATVLSSEILRSQAQVKGYAGEACSECQNFTLVRNGTCMKCDTCGATTGCS